jgi:acyl-CoA reductase-like NAD-dependent aldehyde dehydrogenase
MEHYQLYIGGEWRDSSSVKPVYDKYTGEETATYAAASEEDVNLAVASAKKSFETVKLTPKERHDILVKAAKYMVEDAEAMAQAICRQSGRLLGDSRGEATRSAAALELAAEEATRIAGEMVPVDGMGGMENKFCFTVRVPVGVVCAIAPFNVPLSLTVHKVAPAIAAGNTVVLKPTKDSPGYAVILVRALLKAGLPKEHIQLVLGDGATAGNALLKNQDINFYTFTGSLETGIHIKREIGMRRCSMELGSNAPVIVHSDAADVKKAATLCGMKGYNTAGQICMRPQRLYVHNSVLSEFTETLVSFANSLVCGDPKDPATKIGPMISEKDVDRVDSWVKEAVAGGASVLCGGEKFNSRVYKPTVLTGVKKGMKVVDGEIFGPVMVIIPYDDFDDAIRQANDSIYGLQAGVFTSNVGLAMKAVKEIAAGGVIINETSFTRVDSMPYGGIKMSSAG